MAKICKINNCSRTAYHCSLCCQHYRRWKKYGDPCATPTVDTSSYARRGSCKGHKREYSSWNNMMTRCRNKKHIAYKYYGGSGIEVCERWTGKDGFINFLEDMGERPEGYTLDRIDPTKGYSPDNCRWTDKTTQSYNRRPTKHSTNITGITKAFHHGGFWYIANISKNNGHEQKWFKDIEEAIAWRKKREDELYG